MNIKSIAQEYAEAGFWITPLAPKGKRAVLDDWQTTHISASRVDKLFKDDSNIGLLLGKPTQELFIRAIDVDTDDPDVLHRVECAIGPGWIAKRGQKGQTYLVASSGNDFPNKKIYKKSTEVAHKRKPIIEILGDGNQTVLPPSIHPDTRQPYMWLTASLLDTPLDNLPELNDSVLDELVAIGKDPDCPIFALNTMEWAGVGGGGDTHDVCLSAVGCMVSRGWTDGQIFARVSRAKKAAVERVDGVGSYDWPDEERAITEWVKSARSKGFEKAKSGQGAGGGMPKVRVMSDWIIMQLGGPENIWKYNGEIRRYQQGYWPAVDRSWLAAQVHDAFPNSTGAEIEHSLKTAAMGLPPKQPSSNPAVCLMNGTFDVKTGILREWRADDRLLHRLQFPYDSHAKCSTYADAAQRLFQQHHDESFDLDERSDEELATDTTRVIGSYDEFCALTLVNDNTFKKAMFVRGVPDGGKSQFLNLLMMMHGHGVDGVDNVSAIPISDLADERSRTVLIGKLLNVSAELDASKPISTLHFKAITGGDPVPCRLLYENMQGSVKLPTRFAIFCNEIPPYNDSTGGIETRMLILPADNPVPKENRIPRFFEDHLVPELPGIFNRWMVALKRLYERGRFDVPESSDRAARTLTIQNDTVRAWVSERAEIDEQGKPVDDTLVSSAELYSDYIEWCKATNRRYQLSPITWGTHLSHMGIPPKITRVGGKPIRCRKLKMANSGAY